jgi:hypothetical protein
MGITPVDGIELTVNGQEHPVNAGDQYTAWQMLGIWLAGGAPMWILGWLVYPAVAKGLAVTDAGLWGAV